MYHIRDTTSPAAENVSNGFSTPDRESARNQLKQLVNSARASGWIMQIEGNSEKYSGQRNNQRGIIAIEYSP
jgi:hypothetical protein